jgi:C1A family cysteine protease
MYRIIIIIVLLIIIKKLKFFFVEKFKIGGIGGIMIKKDEFFMYRPAFASLAPLTSIYKLHPPTDIDLPQFFSYDPNVLAPVRDQGSCGACFIFGITSLVADKIAIETNGKFNYNFNVQQILSCYDNKKGCSGGSVEDLAIWLSENKFKINRSSEYEQFDHLEIETPCIKTDGVEISNVSSLTIYQPENVFNKLIINQNVLNMKRELILNGPFYAVMSIHIDFYKYIGYSIYTPTSEKITGGHVVEIVGYCNAGIDKTVGFDRPYWIVKNCWGLKYPEKPHVGNGYFCIEMGKNICGIESRCGTFDVYKNKDKDINISSVSNINNFVFTN